MQINAIYTKALLDAADGCYEYMDSYQFSIGSLTYYMDKTFLRIRPFKRCLDRMIKKNYYLENDSIGSAMDFDLAY
jgi:hypothetical protein